MNKLIILALLVFTAHFGFAQLSSKDIRHTSGKGPYPIFLNVQMIGASTKNTFYNFSREYASYLETPLDGKWVYGFAVNVGTAINEDNFLGFKLKRYGMEAGYRYLFRNITNGVDSLKLHIREETFSIRAGIRGNLLYPLTYQIQAGPVFHNCSSVSRKVDDYEKSKYQIGEGFLEKGDRRKIVAGMDFRARLMFLDPAGTDGGLGFFFEYRYLWIWGKRDLAPFYERVLNQQVTDRQKWDYGSVSFGIVFPFALRVR